MKKNSIGFREHGAIDGKRRRVPTGLRFLYQLWDKVFLIVLNQSTQDIHE
jgi:hypothetical protein